MRNENVNEPQNQQSCQNAVMQSVLKGQNLRVGNLVYFNGNHKEVGVVSEILKNDLTKAAPYKIGINHRVDVYYDIDKLKPIKISEEWLLKCGFKRFPWGLVVDDLLFKDDLKCSYLKLQVGNGFETSVNYIHELQNLYFSLTGRELTVA